MPGSRTVPPVALALLLACLTGSPIAAADATDNTYLDGLKAKGISVTSPAGIIEIGHRICAGLDNGTTARAEVESMIPVFHLTVTQAAFWVGDAIGSYCPWHSDDPF